MDQDDAGALFCRLTDIIRGQLWLPEDRAYGHPLIAAELLSTFHQRHVDRLYIADFEGPTASGKHEVVRLFVHFGHRVEAPAVLPTVAQLYRYSHVEPGEEPKTVVLDEFRLRENKHDVWAILNAGVERGKVVPRQVDGQTMRFRPFGIKVLVHEDLLPARFRSLRRRMIRLQLARSETFRPRLVFDDEIASEANNLRSTLGRWHEEVDLRSRVRRHMTGEGPLTLTPEERVTWPLVLASAEYCGHLDAVRSALEANRMGAEVSNEHWWQTVALPLLAHADPPGHDGLAGLGVPTAAAWGEHTAGQRGRLGPIHQQSHPCWAVAVGALEIERNEHISTPPGLSHKGTRPTVRRVVL